MLSALCPAHSALPGLSLRETRCNKRVCTETIVHGDALCFMGKAWASHKTTGTLLNNGWRLVAVGGGWWRVAVGRWRLVAVGGWRLAVLGGCP